MNIRLLIYSFTILLITSCNTKASKTSINPSGETIRKRISCPAGYTRQNYTQGSWRYFLQNLKLLPNGSKILDYRGRAISNQSSHVAIINYDIGNKDLQQCADAIIRLRAEYLYKHKKFNQIQFTFTSGHNYKWTDHAKGIRPIIRGNKVTFLKKAHADNSYSNFRRYLNIVFTYAGTISLNRDLKHMPRNKVLEVGDIIVKAGSPGHAVLIVDRANDGKGNYLYLLAEGYTPAQSIHILKSGSRKHAPWFKIDKQGAVISSRYFFKNPNIRRF